MRKSAAPITTPAQAGEGGDDPVVTVEQGGLVGEQRGRLTIFRGVPYAAPPVGALRWKPPEPALPWTGLRAAKTLGAACPQPDRGGGGPSFQSEDCLTLNIWAPAGAPQASLPVMVWLHGGGFARGTGGRRRTEGSAFARSGVVLVSLNYRIGPLGFFAHPALTKEAGPGAPLGGYGLMDQVEALRWVQRNIAAFGGDPARVTIFGESAGGHSVLYLLTNPRAKGLFQGAIAQSAPGYTRPRTLDEAEQQGVRMAHGSGLGLSASAQDLRALPLEKIFSTIRDPVPFTDGRFITETPAEAVAAGRDLDVPLVIGTNSDEGSLVKAFAQAADAAMEVVAIAAPALRAAYGDEAPDEARFQRKIFADVVFSAPARWIAGRHAPSWLYQFDYLPAAYRNVLPGTPHSADVGFVFDTLQYGQIRPNAEDRAMARTMHESWVAFAKTGAPSHQGLAWPAYTRDRDETFVFKAGGSAPVAGYRSAVLDIISAVLLDG